MIRQSMCPGNDPAVNRRSFQLDPVYPQTFKQHFPVPNARESPVEASAVGPLREGHPPRSISGAPPVQGNAPATPTSDNTKQRGQSHHNRGPRESHSLCGNWRESDDRVDSVQHPYPKRRVRLFRPPHCGGGRVVFFRGPTNSGYFRVMLRPPWRRNRPARESTGD